MFAYCTDVLHLSDRETGLRIQVARASRKHPVLLTMLRDGRIHLTGIRHLAPVLTRGNRKALLKRATHKSRREIEENVTEKLERLEAKRFGRTKKPRTRVGQADTTTKSRRISAAVKRFVYTRDGGQCTYRDKHGRRCTKRHDLQFHHKEPFGKGGEHGPENVCLMCAAHNALLAEQNYGKEKMSRHRRRTRRASGAPTARTATADSAKSKPRPERRDLPTAMPSSGPAPLTAHGERGVQRSLPERIASSRVRRSALSRLNDSASATT